jgi:hypothetical protein
MHQRWLLAMAERGRSNACVGLVVQGDTCKVSVKFNPGIGTHRATLSFTDDAAASSGCGTRLCR